MRTLRHFAHAAATRLKTYLIPWPSACYFRSMVRWIVVFLVCAAASGMDPQRGAQVARDQNCLNCHNVRGVGSVKNSDLAARLVDRYTPADLASLMWNHLPQMWSAMSADRIGRPRPSVAESEDLFAYLYASHYVNMPGNQERGERAFEQRGCAACHTAGPGVPVENWRGINDPFTLVQRMWNHAPLMQDARDKRGVRFEKLSSRDVIDLTAFVSKTSTPSPATLPETRQGEALFMKNCSACHPGIVNLQKRLQDRTPLEVAAGLWNHAASMQTVPLAAPNDMRSLVGYVWNRQFQESGNAVRGAKTFQDKRCANCHAQMNRGERVFTPYTIMSLSWAHGPLMQAEMERTKTRWPYLSAEDILNLVAYMNTRP